MFQKRMMAFFLSVALCVCLALPAFAASFEGTELEGAGGELIDGSPVIFFDLSQATDEQISFLREWIETFKAGGTCSVYFMMRAGRFEFNLGGTIALSGDSTKVLVDYKDVRFFSIFPGSLSCYVLNNSINRGNLYRFVYSSGSYPARPEYFKPLSYSGNLVFRDNAGVFNDLVIGDKSCSLTVRYQYADGTQAAPDYTGTILCGELYSIPSPVIENHTPDLAEVSGRMGAQDLSFVVTYEEHLPPPPAQHLLTVRYEYEDGSQAFEPYTSTLEAGAPYRVTSPSLVGYRPEQREVAGEMPEEDLSLTVVYREDRYSIIENYAPYDGEDLAKRLMGIFSVILPACVLILGGLLIARLTARLLRLLSHGG